MAKATTPVLPNAALAGSPLTPPAQPMDRASQPTPALLRKRAQKKNELDEDVLADAPPAQGDDVIVLAQASTGAAAPVLMSGGGTPAVLGSLTLPQLLGIGAGTLLVGSALSGGSDGVAAPSGNVAPESGAVSIGGIDPVAPSYTFTEAQLLAKATDANGDKLSVRNLALAEGQTGTLVNNGNGTWTFTPAVNDDTSIELVYEVSDGRLSTDGSATLERDPVTGDVQLLTAGQDHLVFDGFRTVDTVKGVIDYDLTGIGIDYVSGPFGGMEAHWDDKSTFTIGDVIQGNGFTKVELTVDVSENIMGSGMPFMDGEDIDAPYVEMSGVDELVFKAANTDGEIYFHAESYGSDISTIRMEGVDGMFIHVHDLQADETLAIHQATQGDLHVTGQWNGLDIDVSLTDDGDQDVATASSVSLTEAVVSAHAGKDQEISIEIGLDTTEFAGSGNAENGDVTLGDVVLVAEKSGEIDFSAENRAEAFDNTSSENSASVGDLTIGNVSLTLGKYADGNELQFHQDATAEDGSATVGDMLLGNITITGADHAAFTDFYIHQEADAFVENDRDGVESWAATVGDMTVGDVTVTLGYGQVDNDNNEIELHQEAHASSAQISPAEPEPDYLTVDAVIGDTTVGNISFTGGDKVHDANFYVYADADADKGNASVGDLTVGDVRFDMGDGVSGNWLSFSVTRSASVEYTGDASVGNATVGDVTMTAGDGQKVWAYVWQEAQSDNGNATVGDITVGDVVMTVGDGEGTAQFEVSQTANAVDGDATVGNIEIGNVTVTAGESADAEAWLYQWGTVNGGDLTMGDFTVGEITMTAGDGGQAYVSLEMTGDAFGEDDTVSIGDTTVGNVTATAGAGNGAEAGWGLFLNVDEQAESIDSTLGNVTIGDVNISAGKSGQVEFWNTMTGFDDIGAIQFGNIHLDVAEEGNLQYAYVNVSADDAIESFTLGDMDIHVGKNADVNTASDYVYVYADNSIGDVTVGNLDFTVATNTVSSTVLFYDFYFGAGSESNTGVSIGDVSFGDITLSAVGSAFNSTCSGALNVTISVSSYGDIGNVVLGDIALTASGDQAVADLYALVSASSDIGDVTIGNVTINVDALGGSSAHAYATFTLGYAEGGDTIGNINVGDVSLTVNGSSAEAGFYLYNELDSSNAADAGDVTIGNIGLTVSNTEDATDSADVYVEVTAHSDLTVGDITLTQGAMSGWGTNDTANNENDAEMYADVSLISSYGDVVVGDITVTGGYVTQDNLDANDNFDELGGEDSWLDIEADGSITVGNIDYSGYERYAEIDVSDWDGAEEITVGDGGSKVWDNGDANTITLGDKDDLVVLSTDNGGGLSNASDVDVIVGFDVDDDSVELNLDGSLDDYDVSATSYGTYALFLAAAESANEDLFVAKVGGDYYAAVDLSDSNSIDYVVRFEDVQGSLSVSSFIA